MVGTVVAEVVGGCVGLRASADRCVLLEMQSEIRTEGNCAPANAVWLGEFGSGSV